MNVDVSELRHAERFVVVEPLSGTYGPTPVTIMNLSTTGAQIEHPHPLRVGTRGKLAFTRGDIATTIQGTTMWSRLSKHADASGRYLYTSGIRVDSGNQDLAIALNGLFKRGVAKRDPESLERKRHKLLERLSERSRMQMRLNAPTVTISQDEILLVQQARERLLANAEEATKWYNRARYVITQGGETTLPESVRGREDVLAVWEYLERSVDVMKIAAVFDRGRA